MSQRRLSNDEVRHICRRPLQVRCAILTSSQFFAEITSLLTSLATKSHGSIYLTQKPYLAPNSDPASTAPLPLLIRATNGASKDARQKSKDNKVKLATIVQPEDLEAFFAKYADVCKAGMQGLKKRDRSKRKKEKGKKKKGPGETKV